MSRHHSPKGSSMLPLLLQEAAVPLPGRSLARLLLAARRALWVISCLFGASSSSLWSRSM